jgi:glycosyltransferase involved in cell wall biosynthesis
MNNPLVSVCLITYNQENYIQKAIKSIFDQEVGFPIEVIISNDCSSDNTHQKIEEILKDATNGLVVRYYNHKDNLGMMRNFSFAINECKGKYIAYFEGDDYWDYPKKLQTQVDFLEQNPDFAICCHNVRFLENEKFINEIYLDKINIKDKFTLEDLAKHNIVPTLTAVFRNTSDKLPSWILESPIGDLPMFMMVAKHGKIKYINEKWAVYRSNIGEWSKMGNQKNLNMIKQYDLLTEEFNDNIKVKKNLHFARNKYIKEYLKKEKLSLLKLSKNSFFKQLPLVEKAKIIFRKYLN